MRSRVLGDVAFVVVELRRERPGPPVLEPLLRQVEAGTLRVLDFLVVRREADAHRITEVDGDDFLLAGLRLYAPGLICVQDVGYFLPWVPLGAVAAVILVEQCWDLRFVREVEDGGDRILATQAIPSAIANAALAATLGAGS
ncbi:DUF6325 family protein [Microbacterium paraoxydans]|uniref:DUF6325 family protein n=1 Tax=Microbacterium paraoxydans TaxID=199592 RepID=UPI00301418AF